MTPTEHFERELDEMLEGNAEYSAFPTLQKLCDLATRLNHRSCNGVTWNELGRNHRCFRQQGIMVIILFTTVDEQVTLLTNFVLSELLLWTKYLQYALQRMYELANDIDE